MSVAFVKHLITVSRAWLSFQAVSVHAIAPCVNKQGTALVIRRAWKEGQSVDASGKALKLAYSE